MSAHLSVELIDPGALKGLKGIDVLVNGDVVGEGQFGETVTVDLEAGSHEVRLRLRGVVTRTSKPLSVTIADGATTKLAGKYSKLWGNISLRTA